MIQEWYELKYLTGVGGLPTTVQGITKKAKLENWKRRRRAGVKGNVFEYYVGDMPESVRNELNFKPRILKESSTKLNGIDVSISELEASIKTVVNQMEAMFNYLQAGIPETKEDNSFKLNWLERKLIEDYRKASLANKEILEDLAEKMANSNGKKETSEPFEACKVA